MGCGVQEGLGMAWSWDPEKRRQLDFLGLRRCFTSPRSFFSSLRREGKHLCKPKAVQLPCFLKLWRLPWPGWLRPYTDIWRDGICSNWSKYHVCRGSSLMLYSYPDCSCRSDAATAQQPTPCNVYCRSEQDGFNQQKILTTTSMAWEHFSLQF